MRIQKLYKNNLCPSQVEGGEWRQSCGGGWEITLRPMLTQHWRQMVHDVFYKVRRNRRKGFEEGGEDNRQNCLDRSAIVRRGRTGIKSIFCDVKVKGRQIIRGK